MEKLHIITRCTRPINLSVLRDSILINAHAFKIIWHIIFDTNVLKDIDTKLLLELNNDNYEVDLKFLPSKKGAYGYDSVNKISSYINDNEWIYLLDDDNILHENFHQLAEVINSDKSVIVFNQYVNGKDFTGLEYRIASVENTKVGGIDAAQYILKREILSCINTSYTLGYCADGMLMNFLLTVFAEKFEFINTTYSYYNYIQTKINKFSLPKVLVIGLDEPINMTSNQFVDYESNELNTFFIKDDTNIDKVLQDFNPDSVVTIGNKYERFNNLSNKHVDFKKKWIHLEDVNNMVGEYAYQCASNYILEGSVVDEVNPLISFFTPIYNTGDKLKRTYDSLKKQTYSNWEWVVVNDSNDGGYTLMVAEELAVHDSRIKVYDFRVKSGGIVGESKYRAAMLSRGKYLMELDHDDYLTNDAAELMVCAFKKYPDCKFVYSDCAEIYENHSCIKYGDGFAFGYGTYRTEEYNGRIYDVANTCNINPKTIRHIVGVPNHFRAWDAEFYKSISGHNRRLTIADDYELIVRTFLKTRMVRIPKLLYLQYYHNSNTQNLTRADIQRRVRSIRNHYNVAINNRFNELGIIDWAYQANRYDPLDTESLFGERENNVNYIMDLSFINNKHEQELHKQV